MLQFENGLLEDGFLVGFLLGLLVFFLFYFWDKSRQTGKQLYEFEKLLANITKAADAKIDDMAKLYQSKLDEMNRFYSSKLTEIDSHYKDKTSEIVDTVNKLLDNSYKKEK